MHAEAHLGFARVVEMGEGGGRRAADATTQLMQLAKSEQMRGLDYESVHIWDVDPILQDGCANKNINLPVCSM